MRMLIEAKTKSTGKTVQFSVMRFIDAREGKDGTYEVRYDAGEHGTETVIMEKEAFDKLDF